MSSSSDSSVSSGIAGVVCGGIAGAIAGAATTPLDGAKTRLALDMRPAEQRGGVREALTSMYREGGMSVLCRGCIPRTIYVGLSSALGLGAFEWSKALLLRSEL
mmetsp:Transcript_68583/g.149244  ORF Transcript_68583/g.149244 Transcript_68583/m.149244 type:complete len:104 (+) Transcript_68583:2-313(+)